MSEIEPPNDSPVFSYRHLPGGLVPVEPLNDSADVDRGRGGHNAEALADAPRPDPPPNRIDPLNDSGGNIEPMPDPYAEAARRRAERTEPLFNEAEIDALQNAIAHWIADYLIKGWDKPDEFEAMLAAGNKIGMRL